MKLGESSAAGQTFAAALMATHSPVPTEEEPQSLALRALALYSMARLAKQLGKPEAASMCEKAHALVDGLGGQAVLPDNVMLFYNALMAEALFDLGEFRRAIPYCEASIQDMAHLNDPIAVAEALSQAGNCYVNIGLRDHAVVPLRAAVKIFRTLAGDPRFPLVLLDLGNALRTSSPEEAERCYQEVAEYHVSRAQLESATPAWINLAIMYNNQGRHEEALANYERALKIREQSALTSRDRIGTLLNNMANTYCKMGQFDKANFDKAMDCAERARQLLEPFGGRYYASALDTTGLVLRDAGRDQEAVEWFRKSAAEHQKQPSPNLESLCEEFENEAAALDRLGRTEEAAAARARLKEVQESMAKIGGAMKPGGVDADATLEGAVLIELDFGSRTGLETAARLEQRIAEQLREHSTGNYGGRVVIPETTTIMYYGPDAEALFQTIEPVLRQEISRAFAKITVRQGLRHRELMIAGRVM